jgi:lipoprotein-releasing system permease protein
MLTLFLLLRYLRKRRIIFLSITAVALSVALLVVVASLFTGYIEVYERSAVDTLGDILLRAPVKLSQYERLISQLEQTKVVKAATAVMSTKGLLHMGRGLVKGVQVFGVEPHRIDQVVNIGGTRLFRKDQTLEKILTPKDDPGRIGGLIGIGVADEPNSLTDQYDYEVIQKLVGKGVTLMSGTVEERVSSSGNKRLVPKRRNIQFDIADVVFTGNYLIDSESVYLPLKSLIGELYPHQEDVDVGQIHVKLTPNTDIESARAQIYGVWQAFARDNGLGVYDASIDSSVELVAPYMGEIRKQMGVLMLIFGIVDCGVILLVFCIFYMIVKLKQKDIGIIKSFGASTWTCTSIFLLFGVYVGILGSMLGVLLGFLFTKNINAIERQVGRLLGLNLWDSSVYGIEQIPNQLNWRSVLIIVALAITAASLGALIPALVAARTRPVDILRYE